MSIKEVFRQIYVCISSDVKNIVRTQRKIWPMRIAAWKIDLDKKKKNVGGVKFYEYNASRSRT